MSRGRISRRMLEEAGRPCETVMLDYAGAMKAPDYLAINPMGKVRRSAPIWQMPFPTRGWRRHMAIRRGAYYRWLFFSAGPIEAAVTDRSLGVAVPGDKR